MDSGKLIEKKKERPKERQEIHRRIEKLRTEIQKMTQPEFAVALGMDEKKGRVTVNNWEQGLVSIKHDDIAKISTTFNVSADWLIGIVPEPTFDTDKRAVMDYTGLSESSVDFIVQNKKYLISQINDFLPRSFKFFIGMKNAMMQSRKACEYIKHEDCNSDSRLTDILRSLRYSTFDLMESEGEILNQCYKMNSLADTITEILKKRHDEKGEV